MANTYPPIGGGDDITADLLMSMLPRIIVKSTATTRSNTTTFSDDPEMSMTLSANATYFVEFFLYYSAIDAEKFATKWTVPSGVTGNRSTLGPGSSANQANMDNVSMRSGVHAFTTTGLYGTRNSSNQAFAYETGVLVTTSSGTVALQWTQGTSGSTGTTLYNTSFMRVTRLA
jgi:hypothetical protein